MFRLLFVTACLLSSIPALAQSTLNPDQIARTDNHLRQALSEVSGITPAPYFCVQTSTPGKFCLVSPNNVNTCLGNYYTSLANCSKTKSVIQNNLTCYESDRYPGKAHIGVIQRNTVLMQNYFVNFSQCVISLSRMKGKYICLPSASQPGKFFVGDSNANGNVVTPYFASQADCLLGN